MNRTVLVVEDEPNMLHTVSSYLTEEGFHVVTAAAGTTALAVAAAKRPQVIVLDWMLPEMNGLEVCRELRRSGSSSGIILLTAKTEETDKIVGLEVGADDYLTKPFSLRELAARIRSLLRRMDGSIGDDPAIQRDQLVISESKRQVWLHGQEVILTPTEFKILLTLAMKPGIVFSRLQLMRASMEEEFLNYERTIDSHISNLRKKIKDDLRTPKYIQTVYGFGYRFGDGL